MNNPAAEELSEVPIFEDLDLGHAEVVAKWLEVDRVDAGQRLTSEGAAGYAFYVLREGTATVTQGGQEIRTLGPGDFFGELSILGAGRRSATVTASSPAVVWRMFGSSFRMLEEQEPQAAAKVYAAVHSRSQPVT